MKIENQHINLPYKKLLLFFVVLWSHFLGAQDVTAPDTPVIDSVTVLWEMPTNPNGDILITWQACDSLDVRSYYIKYLDELIGTYKFLDSVDAGTTTYLDTHADTDPNYPLTYVIQAVDSSNNASNHSLPHQSVRVFPWQKDENCQTKVELSWNAYQGWEEGIAHVDLYAIINGNHQHIGLFQADELEYLYPIAPANLNYEFYARIKSNSGRSSTSNKIAFSPNILNMPAFIEAEYITVENQQLALSFKLDSTADINHYHLVRSRDSMATFETVAHFDDYNKGRLHYTDGSVNVSRQQYFYRLYLLNDCSQVVDSSRTLSNLVLLGNATDNRYEYFLNWSPYYDSDSYDKDYKLYRYSSFNTESPTEMLESSSIFDYKDELGSQDFKSFVGDFCYYVQVVDSKNNNVSVSNTICLSQEPSVYIPTAFDPNSYIEANRTFKPIYAFISTQQYYFAIYNRWGLKVFETQDYKEGWKAEGKTGSFPSGIYAYYLEYYSSKGKKFVKTGTFNLLK